MPTAGGSSGAVVSPDVLAGCDNFNLDHVVVLQHKLCAYWRGQADAHVPTHIIRQLLKGQNALATHRLAVKRGVAFTVRWTATVVARTRGSGGTLVCDVSIQVQVADCENLKHSITALKVNG